ncbi:branched-chain amino-acid aminotransferase [Escherichia coli]|nr:branched-chain amino-acid aminotransferase [Escherichia coli]
MTTKKADYIWFNGEMVRWEDAKVHVMSHALHYGTSVFEGIRCYDSHKGLYSAIVSICSVCMTPPKSIASRFRRALMS